MSVPEVIPIRHEPDYREPGAVSHHGRLLPGPLTPGTGRDRDGDRHSRSTGSGHTHGFSNYVICP
jgi:hypothetical protein